MRSITKKAKQSEQMRALQAEIRHLKKKNMKRTKKKNMKRTKGEKGRKKDKQRRQRDLLDKGKHDGSDSQSSDPPQHPSGDLATDDDLQSFTDMSNADLEELIRTSPHKREPKKKKVRHKQQPSSSTKADSHRGDAQEGYTLDNSDAEAV